MTPGGKKAERITRRLPDWLSQEAGWQRFFALLRDHRLLARAPPLFRIYIIRTRLRATTKL